MKKVLNITKYVFLLLGLLTLVPMLAVNVESVDMMLYVAYVYFAFALLATVVFTFVNMGKSSNGSKIGIYVFGALIVVGVISYFLSSATPVPNSDGTWFTSAGELKATDTLLYMTYISFAALILILIGGEIKNSLKK